VVKGISGNIIPLKTSFVGRVFCPSNYPWGESALSTVVILYFGILNFGFVSDFDIPISNFPFRVQYSSFVALAKKDSEAWVLCTSSFDIPCSELDIPLMLCLFPLPSLRLVRRSFREDGSWFLRSLGEEG
jgi:hypothetical protein